MQDFEELGKNKFLVDLSLLLDKRTKEIAKKKEQPFKVVIRNKEYHNDAEILNDWSMGIISRYAMEQGIKAFVDYKVQKDIQALEYECELLSKAIDDVYEQKNQETNNI